MTTTRLAFTDEQKRLIGSYYPNLGVVPPNVGTGGLLGVIETAVNTSLASVDEKLGLDTEYDEEALSAQATVEVLHDLRGAVHHAIVQLTDAVVPMVDNAGVVAYGSLKLLDLPAGNILFLGAVADLALTKSSAGVNLDWDGDIGLGSAAANNGAALATTEQDYCPTTATPQAVAGATTGDMKSTSTESCKVLDGTATAKDVFLNILVDDTDHDVTTTPCNIIVNGTVKFTYINLGDN